MIPRLLTRKLKDVLLNHRKIVVLYGPRKAGKTTLVKGALQELSSKVLYVNADLADSGEVFSSRDLLRMKEVIGEHKILFLDEAQNIRDIGINLKLLYDHLPDLKIVAGSSSSLELTNKIQEPLTGRAKTFFLYPIAYKELALMYTPSRLKQQLKEHMIYGMYPEVLLLKERDEKISYLKALSSSGLYENIPELAGERHSEDKLYELLQWLARQTGSIVSFEELGNSLGMDRKTVDHYIELLEKSFMIFRLPAYSRNLKKELGGQEKIYFYDLGIRNALLNNFDDPELRQDLGVMWENFLVAERIKKRRYEEHHGTAHFWKTLSGEELNYVEVYDGQLHGFEFKWKKRKKTPPKSWVKSYSRASYQAINKDNFLSFVL